MTRKTDPACPLVRETSESWKTLGEQIRIAPPRRESASTENALIERGFSDRFKV